MIKFVSIYLFSVFISSCAQILLKSSALETHENIVKEYINWKVILAYSILLCASLITIYAYQGVPLSLGAVLESSAYIYVAILSYCILKEKITIRKGIGMIIILIGIVISNM